MTKSKEFDSTFNTGGNLWTVKITTAIAIKFAGQHNMRLEELVPEFLNLEQMMQLVWMGIQHQVQAEGFDYDGFVDALEGEKLSLASEAGGFALINFTLARMPEGRREPLRKLVQKTVDDKARILSEEDGTLKPIVA